MQYMNESVEGYGMKKMDAAKVLGELAAWGKVGYTGRAFAPAAQTYDGVDNATLNYTHRADSGTHPLPSTGRSDLANLIPLIHASLWEAAFAREAGPLSTWSN